MFFLLYKHTADGVFDDFPKISYHFPKISKDLPKLFRRPDERSRTFFEIFRNFPKISGDCRRLSRKTRRCFDDTPTNISTIYGTNFISVKSSISSHVEDIASFSVVSSAKHRHYEKTLKSSGKRFIYGKLLRHTNKVSLRFLLRDTLHEASFTGHQERNTIDNHS